MKKQTWCAYHCNYIAKPDFAYHNFLKIRPTPASFCLFRLFKHKLREKLYCGIQTRMVRVEGMHACH